MTDVFDPTLENFWGPAQVRLFLDGVWVDDLCAVMYQIRDEKRPKFGYFDRQFRAVSRGHSIVQGQLSINFRYNGYLRSVMEKQIARAADFESLSNRRFKVRMPGGAQSFNVNSIEDVLRLTDDERVQLFTEWATGLPTDEARRRMEAVRSIMAHPARRAVPGDWGDDAGEASRLDVTMRNPATREEWLTKRQYQRPGLLTEGFDIAMVFGTDFRNQYDPALTRVIQNIHLTGESFRVNIDVPDGSRPLREVYNFFARDVVGGDGDSIPSVGGAAGGPSTPPGVTA